MDYSKKMNRINITQTKNCLWGILIFFMCSLPVNFQEVKVAILLLLITLTLVERKQKN